MKPRVDFYLLSAQGIDAQYIFACRLAEKAYRLGHRLFIHTQSQAEANKMDDLLWTLQEDNFIPHSLYQDTPSMPAPIQIGFATDPLEHNDILINLTAEIPEFHERFSRVIEIVPTDETAKQSARQHYKFYKEKGCQLESHKV